MGMIAELFRITGSALKKLKSAPGEAVVIVGEGLGKQTIEAELYQPSGIMGNPPKNAVGVFLPIGKGRRYGVLIATQNYQVSFELKQGELSLYSTNSDGDEIKAQIDLDKNGNIKFNGNSKYLVTYGALNTALQNLVTAINSKFATKKDEAGSAGGLSLDISGCKAESLRTDG